MNDSTPVLHRSKGRPKQKGTQNAPKGTYQKLLISQKVLDSVQRLSRDSVLSTDQLYSRFKLITADERTAEYYWRLVYTISFCQYRDLHARPQVPGTPQLCGERK